MAKKKKGASKKSVKRRATKKTSSAKKTTAKKAAGADRSGTRGTSVDTVLRKFEKERKTKEALLAASRKQITDLESNVTKMQEQIANLKTKASTTQSEIDQLDSRRDAEIAELLLKLGINLSDVSKSAKSPPQRPALTLGASTVELDKKPASDS